MKACTVNSSRSGDPRTTSTTRIWQSAPVKELFQPNLLHCQTAFTWGSQDIRAPRRKMPHLSPAWKHLQPSKWWEIAARVGLHKSFEKRGRNTLKAQGIMAVIVKWGVFSFVKAYGVSVCVCACERGNCILEGCKRLLYPSFDYT